MKIKLLFLLLSLSANAAQIELRTSHCGDLQSKESCIEIRSVGDPACDNSIYKDDADFCAVFSLNGSETGYFETDSDFNKNYEEVK